MIDAAVAATKALGWAEKRLRFELFSAPAPAAGAGAFDVMLKSSGARYAVPSDKTILDVLIAAGLDPLHDCKRGECGLCQVGVVEGAPDHRDYVLTESERASNKLMQICVSRARTPLLVLDL
jgi:ferredoxin